ncbi:hypothetical protein HOK51_03105 [Candidatus Woesearchaeota archaeon]|jgi:hypothetical protein|nr:hypothetical protein [Candidatus Woesearchaeota archaeon]MBT7367946.1 hypothetical protein [Candidatus Woesearchaeota archaeon]
MTLQGFEDLTKGLDELLESLEIKDMPDDLDQGILKQFVKRGLDTLLEGLKEDNTCNPERIKQIVKNYSFDYSIANVVLSNLSMNINPRTENKTKEYFLDLYENEKTINLFKQQDVNTIQELINQLSGQVGFIGYTSEKEPAQRIREVSQILIDNYSTEAFNKLNKKQKKIAIKAINSFHEIEITELPQLTQNIFAILNDPAIQEQIKQTDVHPNELSRNLVCTAYSGDTTTFLELLKFSDKIKVGMTKYTQITKSLIKIAKEKPSKLKKAIKNYASPTYEKLKQCLEEPIHLPVNIIELVEKISLTDLSLQKIEKLMSSYETEDTRFYLAYFISDTIDAEKNTKKLNNLINTYSSDRFRKIIESKPELVRENTRNISKLAVNNPKGIETYLQIHEKLNLLQTPNQDFKEFMNYLTKEIQQSDTIYKIELLAETEKEYFNSQQSEIRIPLIKILLKIDREQIGKIKKLKEYETKRLCIAYDIAKNNINPNTITKENKSGINYLPEFYAGLQETLDKDYDNLNKWCETIITGLQEVARTGQSLDEVMSYAA